VTSDPLNDGLPGKASSLQGPHDDGLPADGLRIRSRVRTITETDVTAFSKLTGDVHPLHLDAEWAKSSYFGERIAPGMLVLSFSVALVELDHSRVIALRRLRNVVFKRPTRFGETIHVDALVTSGKPLNAEIALVALRWIVRDAAEQTLMRASIEVLWRTNTLDPHAVGDPSQQATEGTSLPEAPPGVIPF
jgi:3-hydroxybutyryl-CoA dehydratase